MRIAMVVDTPDTPDTPDTAVGSPDALHPRHQASQLGRALTDLEHDVTLYARRDTPDAPDEESLSPGLRLRRLTAGPARPLTTSEFLEHVAGLGQQLAASWANEPPEIVHTHTWTSALAALVARRGAGIPVVATIPGSEADRTTGSAAGSVDTYVGDDAGAGPTRMERAIRRDVDHLIVGSEAALRDIVAHGTHASKVTVVPRGVDVDHYHPDGDHRSDERTRLVCLGHARQGKDPADADDGFETALAALSVTPDAELVLACPGPAPDRITQMTRSRGLQDRVRVVDELNDQTLVPLLRSANLVLCLGSRDLAGTWALEAMACARPVVASDTGGWAEAIVDGATGALVRPGDAEGLAQAVRDLLSDSIRLEGYGMTARERARARYAWSRVAAETAQVYTSVCPAVSSP